MCDGVDDAFGNGISDLVSLLPYLLEDGGWEKVFSQIWCFCGSGGSRVL